MHWWTKVIEWGERHLGGRARARVIVLLAMTLGLGGADLGAIGSMSSILQEHFSITKSQVGMLITASQGIGIFSTLLFGKMVDRTSRTRLLAIAISVWSLAMIACGAATSYLFLIVSRVALGAVEAATLPCTASLIGDFFPGRERGKIYGYILSGEMLGTGAGFILSGETAALWWRLGFWVLILPAIPLAWWIYKLPEPARGGKGELAKGQNDVRRESNAKEKSESGGSERLMAQKTREAEVHPRERLVREEDPGKQSLWWAIKYVLSIPTNAVLIICSALGYAFFADVRTFGIEYAQSWFQISHSDAIGLFVLLGVGALAGIWIGGRLGDGLLSRGHLPARVWVATGFFWTSVVFFLLAFMSGILWLAVIFFVCSALSLGAVNPPLDSARLDIMHPKLWGRAEAVRMILRDATEAAAPITFGWLVTEFGGQTTGLHDGFLLMLIPLALAGGLAFITFRTYAADAAAASAYRKKTM